MRQKKKKKRIAKVDVTFLVNVKCLFLLLLSRHRVSVHTRLRWVYSMCCIMGY